MKGRDSRLRGNDVLLGVVVVTGRIRAFSTGPRAVGYRAGVRSWDTYAPPGRVWGQNPATGGRSALRVLPYRCQAGEAAERAEPLKGSALRFICYDSWAMVDGLRLMGRSDKGQESWRVRIADPPYLLYGPGLAREAGYDRRFPSVAGRLGDVASDDVRCDEYDQFRFSVLIID